jgi:peptidoglycan/LPS O-acetylase OafA/YrhL
MNSTRRAAGLDGLRGIAAAAVVLLHVWMFSGAHQAWQPKTTDEIVGCMGLALMLFFVLSGMLIVAPWIRAGAGDGKTPALGRYVVRRAMRIVPAYWVCLGGSYLMMQHLDHPLAVELSELPTFALFAQNQVSTTLGQLNPPLWSLGIEAAFYLVLPIVGLAIIWAMRRYGRTGAVAVAAIVAAVGLFWTACVYGAGSDPTLVSALPTYLPIFACGIAAAAALHDRQLGRVARTALMVVGAGLVYGDARWHIDGTGTIGHIMRDLPAGVGFAMIAAAVAQGPAWVLSSLPLRKLGDWSYGIYLWHMPVLYFFLHTDRWPDSPWRAFATVFGIATVLGAASYLLIERHAVNFGAWLLARQPAVPLHRRVPAHISRGLVTLASAPAPWHSGHHLAASAHDASSLMLGYGLAPNPTRWARAL